MNRAIGRCSLMLLLFATLVAGGGARADSPIDAWDLMFWAGYYAPGPDALDGDLSLGARVGYHANRRSFLSGEVQFVNLDTQSEIAEKFTSKVNAVEFTYTYKMLPERRTSVIVAGGVGYSNVDVDGNLFPPFDDSFTVSGTIGLRANVKENFYIRPAVRLRWFESREHDPVDTEFQIGFGLVLY